MKKYHKDILDFDHLIAGINNNLDDVCRLMNAFDETKENFEDFVPKILSKMDEVYSKNLNAEELLGNAKLECYMNDYIHSRFILFSFYRNRFDDLKFNYLQKAIEQIQKHIAIMNSDIKKFTENRNNL